MAKASWFSDASETLHVSFRSSSISFQRAQHTLRETEKVLSAVHCASDHGKDMEGTKAVERTKNYSPKKMTRSMSLRKKNRPTPPPPKPEAVSSGMTEEQMYLSQVSLWMCVCCASLWFIAIYMCVCVCAPVCMYACVCVCNFLSIV